mgnify:FL=1
MSVDLVRARCECRGHSDIDLVNAEKLNYFKSMGCGRLLFHIFMLLVTAFVWCGWLLAGWLLTKNRYYCVECKRRIKKENIVLNTIF